MKRIYNFMYGRYGFDELNNFLLLLSLVLILLNTIIKSKIVNIIEIIPLTIFTIRFLSKNTYQRQKEN